MTSEKLDAAGDRRFFQHARRNAPGRRASARRSPCWPREGRSDTAQVMALGSQLQVLTQPSLDAGALRAAVDSMQPGDSRASFGELARAVRSLAETVPTPIELHLFSDMQKSAMPAKFRGNGAAGKRLAGSASGGQGSRAELDGGKRQCAGPGVGSEEGARAGGHRRIRDAGAPRARFRWS